jgi:extracellular elastinolytic metalloproteinase
MPVLRSGGRSRRPAVVVMLAAAAAAAASAGVPGAASGSPTTTSSRASSSMPASTASPRQAEPVDAGRSANLDARDLTSSGVPGGTRETARRAQAIASLGPSARVDVDPLTGTPDDVSTLRGYLTGRSGRAPRAVALGWVRAHAAALGLGAADLSTLRLRSRAVDVHGVTHLSWTQEVDGVPVFGNGLRAHVTSDGRLLSVQGAPVAGLATLGLDAPRARLDSDGARAAAADDVGGVVAATATARSAGATRKPADGDAASRVWFLTPSGLRPAWATFTQPGEGRGFQHVVDAVTGRVLYRHDLASAARGDALVVRNYPGARAGGAQAPVNVIDRGWLRPRATWLDGANAIAWADLNADDAVQPNEKTPVPGKRRSAQFKIRAFDTAPGCGARYVCTWDPDTPFSWRKNKNQDVTQAFVLSNLFHDYLEHAPFGFTPQMGNFEAAGGDPVLVNALDGANTDGGLPDSQHVDGSSMVTPPDGIPPTLQTYLFHRPGATMQQDPFLPTSAANDASILLHEYAHGLSNRLVVDAAGNSTLMSFQALAMGEAWSDYYALDYLVRAGVVRDTPASGEVLFGRYVQRNRPVIRSEAIDCAVVSQDPLCTKADLGAGGYTLADMGTTATGGPDPHSDAMIWAQTLWDLRKALGHRVAGAIVTEAMSLSPADPSFLDERNAILSADQAVYGGAHRRLIWRVFAHRGMGWFASVSDSSDTSAVEDFSMPLPPATPRATVSGAVTDHISGEPVVGAVVVIGGHPQWTAVTNKDGEYSIRNVVVGDYPELLGTATGYDVGSSELVVSAPTTTASFSLRRDWASSEGGGSIADLTGPDFGAGCGPDAAIDLSAGDGWSTHTGSGQPTSNPQPKHIDIRLPEPIDIHSFGIDPSPTCGDGPSSATRGWTISVSLDGEEYSRVAQGAFTRSDIGHVNEIELGDSLPGVQYVRVRLNGSQVPAGVDCSGAQGDLFSGCTFMDMSEFEVYGVPGPPESEDVQVLSLNNLQGHLLAGDPPLSPQLDPSQTPVGGVEYLATLVKTLRASQPDSTLTVAAGDLIGSSPPLSAQFQDQPTIDALDALGLDVSTVANGELEEGTAEFLRIVGGGCQPSGCFKDPDGNDIPYDGAGFDYITANVVNKSDGSRFLPPTATFVFHGLPIGVIGISPQDMPDLVDPDGVSSVDFLDEMAAADNAASALREAGVETIIVLLHDSGAQDGAYNDCDNLTGPVVAMAQDLSPEIDLIVAGHTNVPYVCTVDDPAGNPRYVTSAGSFGRVLTETHLTVDRATREVVRPDTTSTNHLVVRTVAPDPAETNIIEFWQSVAQAN